MPDEVFGQSSPDAATTGVGLPSEAPGAFRSKLRLEALMAEAQSDTGLRDWGQPDVVEPLSKILHGLVHESRLNAAGRRFALGRIQLLLRNRLRLVEDRRVHPEIRSQRIVRPIILAGLPRAGTTLTHNLLCQNPGARSPRNWEMLMPSPPGPADLENDPRVKQVQQYLADIGFLSPDIDRIHPYDARMPDEDGFLLENAFMSGVFNAYWRMPTYQRWLLTEGDGAAMYKFQHEFLQHAQWRSAGDHWVLKWPNHLFYIPQLLAAFPDAIVVQNHRDPTRVIPSVTKLQAVLRTRGSDEVDAAEIASLNVELYGLAAERVMRARQDPRIDARFFDIDFFELNNDPLGVMDRLHRTFDLPLSEITRDNMAAYLAAHPRGRHGANDYALEDYDLTEAQIDTAFRGYMERFGIKPERR